MVRTNNCCKYEILDGIDRPLYSSFAQTIVYLGSTAVYNVYFHPLARFPGPKARAISEWPYFRAMIDGTDPQRILGMHNKYGPVVRVSPNELAFVRPGAFRDIYGYKKGGKPELSKDKKYFSGMGEPSLVKSPDPTYHAHLRRLLAPGFSDAALRKQEAVIQEYLTIFMSKLEGESQNGDGCVDVVLWFKVSNATIRRFIMKGVLTHIQVLRLRRYRVPK